MGTNDGLDEHLKLCRQDVNIQIAEVPEQVKRAYEALDTERAASDERIVKMRERLQQRDGKIGRAKAVLDDYFDSPEPRSIQHAMQALRRIICEGE